jgi:mannose-6-phosphate isomerase-like protein (cupin superfamily)
VKSIVSKLKDQGRREFHEHRSVYHPWGILKQLDETDNCTAAELTVNSDSALELPANKNTAYHLFVVKGQATVSTGSNRKILNSRESITCSAQAQVRIENTEKAELSLIQLALKNQTNI